ncbi:glycosyltransferase family 2 protein [Granulicella arctica]|uniref:glycosyltransferase family 2 protein n=1 Tax=Granulicella arctica TaxID=940613 RepID=UPI0021E0939E|nr:glycosyltransferase family A protein [Granulicella arctica]
MPKYVIITPVRDEEEYIERTILSVIRQTILPIEWIIVNDGSVDGTGAVIDHYGADFPWIKARHRPNRGYREAGGGVINTFYDGYDHLESESWDFLVKLDGDLSFSADYFERCFDCFESDKRLGIGGGGIYHEVDGKVKLESHPMFHVRGATKIYRRECWKQLGGLLRAPGWDTIDEVKANMLGWRTRTFAELRVSHYRFTGAAEGAWKDSVKNGRANYATGYHPLFFLLKCVRRIYKKPYLSGTFGLMWGFLSGYIKSIPRVEDAELIAYTRKQQLRRLCLLESIWK